MMKTLLVKSVMVVSLMTGVAGLVMAQNCPKGSVQFIDTQYNTHDVTAIETQGYHENTVIYHLATSPQMGNGTLIIHGKPPCWPVPPKDNTQFGSNNRLYPQLYPTDVKATRVISCKVTMTPTRDGSHTFVPNYSNETCQVTFQ